MATSDENATKTTHVRGPHLECNVDSGASTSGAKGPPPPSRLEEVRAKLSTPLTAGADPTTIEADPEAHRQLLLKQAEEVASAKRWLDITRCELDRAHGCTPAGNDPSRADLIRGRGGGLGAEIERDSAESPAPSTELPVYNTPEKNMLVAEAPVEELCCLEGEELHRQTRRVTELLHIANKQQKNPRYDDNATSASHAHGAADNNRGAPKTRWSHPLLRQAGAGIPSPPTTTQAERAG
jgi:hypothetical protein